jgi:hypothetical protein
MLAKTNSAKQMRLSIKMERVQSVQQDRLQPLIMDMLKHVNVIL